MAVGHRVRNRELLKSAGTSCLDNSDISNVMRSHSVEFDAQLLTFASVLVMGTENSVCDSIFASLIGRWHTCGIIDDSLAVFQVNAMWNQFNHKMMIFVVLVLVVNYYTLYKHRQGQHVGASAGRDVLPDEILVQ